MLNILPYEEKKKVLTEYRLRLAVVGVFAAAALVLASLVLLIPSYMLAVSKYNFTASELARLEQKQRGASQEKEVNAQIKETNKKISLFLGDKKGAERAPSAVVLGIIAIKDPAVNVQSILYDIKPDRERLVLSGRAGDRDSLARFVETLKKDPSFSKVELPIGSYVKSTNIDFSLVLERTLEVAPPKK
jgi:Tfp pilus assembly protein PilN